VSEVIAVYTITVLSDISPKESHSKGLEILEVNLKDSISEHSRAHPERKVYLDRGSL